MGNLEPKDFDPQTHGAPEINRPEPKLHGTPKDADETVEENPSSPDMGLLAQIAKVCSEPFTEKREEEARVCIRKREWTLKPPFDPSKKR